MQVLFINYFNIILYLKKLYFIEKNFKKLFLKNRSIMQQEKCKYEQNI